MLRVENYRIVHRSEDKMFYGEIKNYDIANGLGVRVSLFVSGCTNKCEGCFQPETWDFCYGKEFSAETQAQIIEMLAPSYINGLTVLGGEPFEPDNQKALLPFLKNVKQTYPDKDIWVFTGFTFEELARDGSYCRTEFTDDMLRLIDTLVDGRFVLALKDIGLQFRGSSNQRILDLKSSLEAGQPILRKMDKR